MGCNCNDCKDPYTIPVGPQGPQGVSGASGGTGSRGREGEAGPQGEDGPQGEPGDDGRGYDTVSTNSIDVLTTLSASVSSITVEPEKAYRPGARVRFSDTNNIATNYFEGIVSLYNPVTGDMNITNIDLHRGSGTIADWQVNVTGERGSDVYDSGWKVINAHNGTFGLAPVSGWTNPSIRVVGHTVFINGNLLIPLGDQTTPSTLKTNAAVYATTDKAHIKTYTGSDGGYGINSNGSILSNSPVIPTELRPTLNNTIIDGRNLPAVRAVQDGTGARTIILNNEFISSYFRTDGKFLFVTHRDIDDTASGGSYLQSSPTYKNITKASTGEFAPDYSSAKNSFAGAVWQGDPVVTTYTYPVDVDGENPALLGGYFLGLDMSYPINSAYTEAQIRAAFDSI